MEKNIDCIEVLKYMLKDLDFDFNMRSNQYRCEIYRSVTYLIANNCKFRSGDGYNFYVKDIDCARDKSGLFRLMYDVAREGYYNDNNFPYYVLYHACLEGYCETVKYLISQGVEVNFSCENPSGKMFDSTYMFNNVYHHTHNIGIAYLLLKSGINLNGYAEIDSDDLSVSYQVIDCLINMYKSKSKQKAQH